MDVAIGKRLFGLALIVALSTSGLLAVAVLLFAEFDHTTWRILGTTALLGLASLLALPGGVLLDQGRHAPLAWAAIALSALGFVLAMAAVWSDPDSDDFWRLAASVAVWAGAFSQTAAMTSRRRRTDTQGVRVLYLLSIATAFLLAILVVGLIWEHVDESEGYIRFLGAIAVTDVLLALLQPAARRLRGGATGTAPPREANGHRLVFTLDGDPSEAAVDEARAALERGGARVERVERLS